jgi:hypothetical protein
VRKAPALPIQTKPNVAAQRPKPALRVNGILGSAILLAAAGAMFFGLSYLHAPSPTMPADWHSGSILITSAGQATCRRLKFDNVTGSIKDEGIGQCTDSSLGEAERLGQVSQSFVSHNR